MVKEAIAIARILTEDGLRAVTFPSLTCSRIGRKFRDVFGASPHSICWTLRIVPAIVTQAAAGSSMGGTMRNTSIFAAVLAGFLLASPVAMAQQSTMPPDAKVYIIWPSDGQVIKGAFWVRMGLSGAGIAPAGVHKANTGHHHLLIDVDLPPLDQPIPNDRNHLHFGLGQTEARLDLPPGKHTLQMLLGDENHVPHQPPLYSKRITITVVQ
jgi:hypothetical protein